MAANVPYMDKMKAVSGADMKANMGDKSKTKKYFSEFVGAFMLVFTIGMIKTAGKNNVGLSVFGPTAIASILVVMIYAMGPISGGHFNPAVTFAVWLQKNDDKKEPFHITDAAIYIISQLVAGALAGVSTMMLFPLDASSKGSLTVGPSNTNFVVGAPLVEFVYTFMLCFVVLNVAVAQKKKENSFYGVAIGFVIIAGGYGGGAVSGGCFNPAVVLGLNIVDLGNLDWRCIYLPIYWAVQLAGAFFATVFFNIVRVDERPNNEDDPVGKLTNKIMAKLDPEDTSEMLGSLLLTFTVGLNVLMTDPKKLNQPNPGGVFSIAACLMCMIYAVGDVSGGLFNPALTLSVLVRYFKTGQGFGDEKLGDPKMCPKEGPKYLVAQLIGGALGAALTFIVYMPFFPASFHVAAQKPHNLAQAFFAELCGTFLLSYVVLSVATVKTPLKEYTAYAIGSCIIGAGYAFGPLSGGLLNPAIVVGAAAFNKLDMFYTAGPILFVLAECIGGVLAALIFRFVTHHHEYDHMNDDKDLTYVVAPS